MILKVAFVKICSTLNAAYHFVSSGMVANYLRVRRACRGTFFFLSKLDAHDTTFISKYNNI